MISEHLYSSYSCRLTHANYFLRMDRANSRKARNLDLPYRWTFMELRDDTL